MDVDKRSVARYYLVHLSDLAVLECAANDRAGRLVAVNDADCDVVPAINADHTQRLVENRSREILLHACCLDLIVGRVRCSPAG